MRVQLAVAGIVNGECVWFFFFFNVQANMAAGDLPIKIGIFLTNRKLPSIMDLEYVPQFILNQNQEVGQSPKETFAETESLSPFARKKSSHAVL